VDISTRVSFFSGQAFLALYLPRLGRRGLPLSPRAHQAKWLRQQRWSGISIRQDRITLLLLLLQRQTGAAILGRDRPTASDIHLTSTRIIQDGTEMSVVYCILTVGFFFFLGMTQSYSQMLGPSGSDGRRLSVVLGWTNVIDSGGIQARKAKPSPGSA
jgi:hypothetical protein